MVAALGVLVIVAVLQLALATHVRNTLIDAAAEGARYAALADNSPSDGVLRTGALIRAALGSDYADAIQARSVGESVEVTVIARIPLFGFLGFERSLEVSGHAIRESF